MMNEQLLPSNNDGIVIELKAWWDGVSNKNSQDYGELSNQFDPLFQGLNAEQKIEVIQHILIFLNPEYSDAHNNKEILINAISFLQVWAKKNTDNMNVLCNIINSTNKTLKKMKESKTYVYKTYSLYCTVVMGLANYEIPVSFPEDFYEINENSYALAHFKATFYLLAHKVGLLPEEFKYLVAYHTLGQYEGFAQHIQAFQNILSDTNLKFVELPFIYRNSDQIRDFFGKIYIDKLSLFKKCLDEEMLLFSKRANMLSFYHMLNISKSQTDNKIIPKHIKSLIEIFQNYIKDVKCAIPYHNNVSAYMLRILCYFIDNKYTVNDVIWAEAIFKLFASLSYDNNNSNEVKEIVANQMWIRHSYHRISDVYDPIFIRRQAQLATGIHLDSRFNIWRILIVEFNTNHYIAPNDNKNYDKRLEVETKTNQVINALWSFYTSNRTENDKSHTITYVGHLLDSKNNNLAIDFGEGKSYTTLRVVMEQYLHYLNEYKPENAAVSQPALANSSESMKNSETTQTTEFSMYQFPTGPEYQTDQSRLDTLKNLWDKCEDDKALSEFQAAFDQHYDKISIESKKGILQYILEGGKKTYTLPSDKFSNLPKNGIKFLHSYITKDPTHRQFFRDVAKAKQNAMLDVISKQDFTKEKLSNKDQIVYIILNELFILGEMLYVSAYPRDEIGNAVFSKALFRYSLYSFANYFGRIPDNFQHLVLKTHVLDFHRLAVIFHMYGDILSDDHSARIIKICGFHNTDQNGKYDIFHFGQTSIINIHTTKDASDTHGELKRLINEDLPKLFDKIPELKPIYMFLTGVGCSDKMQEIRKSIIDFIHVWESVAKTGNPQDKQLKRALNVWCALCDAGLIEEEINVAKQCISELLQEDSWFDVWPRNPKQIKLYLKIYEDYDVNKGKSAGDTVSPAYLLLKTFKEKHRAKDSEKMRERYIFMNRLFYRFQMNYLTFAELEKIRLNKDNQSLINTGFWEKKDDTVVKFISCLSAEIRAREDSKSKNKESSETAISMDNNSNNNANLYNYIINSDNNTNSNNNNSSKNIDAYNQLRQQEAERYSQFRDKKEKAEMDLASKLSLEEDKKWNQPVKQTSSVAYDQTTLYTLKARIETARKNQEALQEQIKQMEEAMLKKKQARANKQ